MTDRKYGIVEYPKDKIDVSYDDVTIGTPIIIGGQGSGIVQLPIMKEEEVAFRDRIKILELKLKQSNENIRRLTRHLSRHYRRFLKIRRERMRLYYEELEAMEEY